MTAYRGYLISHNHFRGEFIVTKDSAYIATYANVNAAKRGIDELIPPFVDVQHETAYGETVKLSRVIRVF